ncbi:SEL1-like repeat protein [Terricaulis silvestris]|uniref:Polar organelle development protein n=1 Tax=Terricaulis silvestris TaxID=2686094 RepID=A0A6I6MN89_9CAUL|nr:SEL1-like repeat protein [Terricaulis silvestris]QGZ94217.1 Polar organelle development protein [Terricaulis silvestris]
MSGAQSWSVKGIDPKVREAAREAAARQGMSLGEYLSHALAGNTPVGGTPTPTQTPPQPGRQRSTRYFGSADENTDDDWSIGGSTSRVTDPARLAQRIESIERRTQLAVTGLDRAVSTIDRSLLGLAARVEDAEAAATESADRIGDALDQFRAASDTLSGTHGEISSARERLEHQVSVAEEVARRAEAAASYLSNEMESRDSALKQTLSEARGVAEEAARQAAEASSDAVQELRRLQEQMSERLAETETSTRRAVETAIAEVRSETISETRGTREALLEEVVRLESEIAKRVGAVDTLKSEQSALIERIERAEAGSRESTAGLRQAAGAAIADLRNAQLTLSARVKQVEDIAGASGAIDLSDLRHAQTDIAERLGSLETKHAGSPVTDALAAFEARLAAVEHGGGSNVDGAVKTLDVSLQRLSERIAETESTANTAIRTLEETVSSLGARVEQGTGAVETEAVRAMLEHRLDGMAQDVAHMVGEARTELAGQLQAAMEGVAGEGLEGALADVNRRLAAAERRQAQTIEAISLEIRRMSETVDKRLRTVESRNDDAAGAAVREELSKMATTLEKRFDDIERREAGAFDRMGLEIGRLSERLEERVGAVEGRSAQAIEQVGEQVARMADRFNQRQDILARDLGERMLDSEERAGQRVTEAINSIMQRLAEVEEHSAEAIMPVQKAVSSVASKLERIQSGHDAEPLAAPMDSIPTPSRRSNDFDFPSFDEPSSEPYVSPMAAAQPVRAAPLAPSSTAPQLRQTENEHDVYFAEEIDDLLEDDLVVGNEADVPFTPPEYRPIELSPDTDLLIDDPFLDDVAAVTPPPEDDDPFWSPNAEVSVDAATPLASAPATFDATTDFDDGADFGDLPDLDAELHDTLHGEAQALDLTPASEAAPAPVGKNDYLANARKAAQAQAQTKPAKPGKEPKAAKLPKQPKAERESARVETPKLSLRGSSRIILWGAASLVALAIVGGAKYISERNDNAGTAEPQPAAEPTAAPMNQSDPNAPYGAAPDPFAEAPAEGLAPVTGANGEAAVAANDAPVTPIVAGPLPARASVSLEQAATSGNLTAQYELALQRIAAGRPQEGVTMLRRAADRGFAMAQYRLAKLYERGEGVQADLAVARQWTERAAASGNRRAMHDLGVYFARGEGAPLDEAAAFRWFRQAAELGVADSQYNLGVLYQQGRGVNASASEALFWFLVAARQGDQDAGARATALEGQLQRNQVEQARARAQAFRPRAASAVANGEFGQRAWATRPAT